MVLQFIKGITGSDWTILPFFQNKVELRKRDKYFVRFYHTQEDAGNSYDPYFTSLLLTDKSKDNVNWASDYVRYWQNKR